MLDQQSGRLKITDFGTSRRLTDILIRTDRHAGAWAYQAPEIQQANQRGAISDLFSVGAVLYHVIVGSPPRATIHDLITSAPITRPRQFNPSIPAELDELTMKLLQHDIAERMPTAHALVKRLEEFSESKVEQRVPTPLPLPMGTGYLDRAAALVAEGKTEEARRTAAEATLHSTGLVPALELYARLSDQLGYTDDAIKAYTKLLALENSATDMRRSAESQLADLYLRLHRYEEAERHIEATLDLPNSSRPMKFKAAVVFGGVHATG